MDDPISPEIYLPIIAGIDAGPFGSSRSMVLSGLENFYLLKMLSLSFRSDDELLRAFSIGRHI